MTTGTWRDELALAARPSGIVEQTATGHWFWLEFIGPSDRPRGEEANDAIVRFAWDGSFSEPFELIPQRDESAFVWAPDSSHIAYFGKRGDSLLIGVDGEQRQYAGFSRSVRPTFSPDGAHLAYGAQIGDAWRLVVDGEPYGAWNTAPLPPVYSPDGSRLAFAAENFKLTPGASTRDYRQWIVLDGLDEPSLGMISADEDGMAFSPDGRRFAYGSILDEEIRMVVDGLVGPAYRLIAWPTFSPDSRRLVYSGGSKGAMRLVGEGVGGTPTYELIGPPVFSPDSGRLAHAAILSKGRVRMVTDGEVGPEFADLWENVGFSPDSRRVAYLALRRKEGLFGPRGTWCAVVDGTLTGEWDEVGSEPHFSPDSRQLAFTARRGKEWFMVVDGVAGDGFKQVSPPRYGADGRLWSTVERAGGAAPFSIRADGVVVVEFDEPSEVEPGESFLVSGDGRHMASAVRIGDSWHPVVDGSIGPGYAAVGGIRFTNEAISFTGLRDDGIHRISFQVAAPQAVAAS